MVPAANIIAPLVPRGVRHEHLCLVSCDRAVSIHAPAWGATRRSRPRPTPSRLFQSTHPRGVRLGKTAHSIVPSRRFNPRTRVGCDKRPLPLTVRQNSFNPRTRVGCDWNSQRKQNLYHLFQSTHPRGVRLPCVLTVIADFLRFQSTHPRGVRLTDGSTLTENRCLFQSTHPRGVRHI